MTKKSISLDNIGNAHPFRVPEGYFDSLTESIMAKLPDRVEESPKVVPLWGRVKPWLYMAAMIAGVALMLTIFVPKQPTLNLTSAADIEDFYQFYEEQITNNAYNETLYLEEDEWEE
jgi:hypothetical protein